MIMNYRLAKKGETTNPRYTVYDGEGGVDFTRTHEGLEAAITLANELKSFIVATNVNCTTEKVWTHPELKARVEQDKCAQYR